MRAHCATLVEQALLVSNALIPHLPHICPISPHISPISPPQALLVSNELIRCAILWGEMWHEALEQAGEI